MSTKTRKSTRDIHCALTRSRTKNAHQSQTDDNPRKRKRSSSSDERDFGVSSTKNYIAICNTGASTAPKKLSTTPQKTATKSMDYAKELKKIKKDYAQVQNENIRLKEHNKTLEAAREADAEKIMLDANGVEEITACEICDTILWSPFLLPNCGHTFCQSCIERWFSQALAKHAAIFPDYDYRRTAGEQSEQISGHPSYTCPKCRTATSVRPVENFFLKTLVRSITSAIDRRKDLGSFLWKTSTILSLTTKYFP
ncbi:hypothetical protein BDZ94DRAFT_53921 [Collybia nuda]|uniref:RING-type domain-containing protein n=1 Tax=Collybia nuda TaxID=64659 RepID=A0A9P5YBM8_9AGAR|nr:hypothetical protein BDZ94DRAFT_53921 [Collybia nuda]